MCLSNVYAKRKDSETLLMGGVGKISVYGEDLVLTDLLERDTRIRGRLISADLVSGKVLVDTGEEDEAR